MVSTFGIHIGSHAETPMALHQCVPLTDSRRFRFDPSQIESVDQMLLGARIAQSSLSPVAEESVDGAEQQATYSEKIDKTLER